MRIKKGLALYQRQVERPMGVLGLPEESSLHGSGLSCGLRIIAHSRIQHRSN